MKVRLEVCAIVTSFICACGGTAANASATPSADSAAQRYVALVNGFWEDHVAATSGALQVCVGAAISGTTSNAVNPRLCKARGEAMLAVQQRFADDLAGISAPARFAGPDQAIRTALPGTLADLKAMISASGAGNKSEIQADANRYIADMQPILGALDEITPGIQHT
jgi:hypothetical protein